MISEYQHWQDIIISTRAVIDVASNKLTTLVNDRNGALSQILGTLYFVLLSERLDAIPDEDLAVLHGIAHEFASLNRCLGVPSARTMRTSTLWFNSVRNVNKRSTLNRSKSPF